MNTTASRDELKHFDSTDVKETITEGTAYIQCTLNDIVIIITSNSNVVSNMSSGQLGFKGSKKVTPSVAIRVAETAAKAAMEYGLKTVDVSVKGPGSGREAAIKTLQKAGLKIRTIKDVTPIPHNACKPPKPRRWR